MESPYIVIGPTVGEQRRMPRYQLGTHVDVTVRNGKDSYWGALINLSRTGVAINYWQYPKRDAKVTLRFRLQSSDRRLVTEELTARTAWISEDAVGLHFDPVLVVGSPALQKAPCLVGRLVEKEAGL